MSPPQQQERREFTASYAKIQEPQKSFIVVCIALGSLDVCVLYFLYVPTEYILIDCINFYPFGNCLELQSIVFLLWDKFVSSSRPIAFTIHDDFECAQSRASTPFKNF
jgi:hypothetical protein